MMSGRGGQVLTCEKKQVNVMSLIVAIFLLLGVVGMSSKASAAPTSNVGIVDFQFLMSQQPDMAIAQQTIKTQAEQAQKDFNEKTAAMTNDQDKQVYFNQLQQQLDEKRQALLTTIQDKVIAVIKTVADAKGLAIVLDKSDIIYGGRDITVEVGRKISGK